MIGTCQKNVFLEKWVEFCSGSNVMKERNVADYIRVAKKECMKIIVVIITLY